MTGPLTISGLGTWKGSRVNLDYITAKGENDTVNIGTPENEQNLRVYSDKVKVTDVPISLKRIIGFADGYGTYYEGAYSEPDHIATKKDVDAAKGSPMSAKLMVGFQVWSEGRLSEGCFNLLDENKQVTSKAKGARFLTFHIIQGWDHCEWMSYALRGKGQIHLMDKDGKYLLSKFVMGAEKREAGSGDDPVDALWFFELEEYGFDVDVTLSGNYFMEFDHCLEAN
jgi:hypothetical protein